MKYDEGSKNTNNLGLKSYIEIEYIASDQDICTGEVRDVARLGSADRPANDKSPETIADLSGQRAQTAEVLDRTNTAQKISPGLDSRMPEKRPADDGRDLDRQLLQAREAERRRIARDIHDGPAQSLAALLLGLDMLGADLSAASDPGQMQEKLREIKEIARSSMDEIRGILYDLKPVPINDSPAATLQDYFDQIKAKSGLEIILLHEGTSQDYTINLHTAIFRLVQEAVNNIKKHAGTNRAWVCLSESARMLSLLIKDEGCGFDQEKELYKPEVYGIAGMKERTQLLGGEFSISSIPGSGTQILIEIPLKGEALR